MVRWIKDPTGRFKERPFYQPKELDDECERIVTQFLVEKTGSVLFPIETDHLTVLVDKMASDLDLYADLSENGLDVEGVTEFAKGWLPSVAIAGALSEDDRRVNRLRTTLTHELGHVRFHDGLFQTRLAAPDLFAPAARSRVICKRDSMVDAPFADWMEWQACYASGAFLMPKSALIGAVVAWRREKGVEAAISANDQRGQDLIEVVKTRFGTSAEAAKVRMMKLDIIRIGPATPTLFD